MDLRANRTPEPSAALRTARRRAQANEHYERALVLEASDVAKARVAYTAALAAYGGHLEARINLGRLLHLEGELDAAEKVYRQAKEASATLSFNLALLLEDLKRDAEAVRAYRDALALDPVMHEAHLNLGLLHHRLEQPREALRHMLAYRRVTQSQDRSISEQSTPAD
jgi:tetratricopeptide (TPR) repeat protein